MEENRVSAFRIRGLAAIMGFSNDRNPPVASTPPADRGRSPGSPEPSPRAGGTGPPGPKPGGNRTQRPAGHLQELLHVAPVFLRSEEHTSELQSLMRISYAVFCLKKKKTVITTITPLS